MPFAIKHEDYLLKTYKENNSIIIGWMGSPENFENVLKIEEELIEIENSNPQVSFVFICREFFKIDLKRVRFLNWSDEGFDYYQTIKSFDIAIAPMVEANERNLAKTAFKSLEYMSSGLAFVSSPWGIPEYLIHNENVMIAKTKDDWINHLNELSIHLNKRKTLGQNAYNTMIEKFSYSVVYKDLKKILFI